MEILNSLGELTKCIEYIEDPFRFHEKRWILAQEKTGVSFAADWSSLEAIGKVKAAPFLVIKPARQPIERFKETSQKLIVTTSLDHPIGQLGAAYAASQLPVETCGLLTHSVYKPNQFSEQLHINQARLVPPRGFGWGFDEELERLSWK